uniref:Ig-like domain-containing protein n=1 Tax=Cyprinodon variegatus TaxID=28743 RepID=A0A3Q2CKT7_CYPVA
FDQSVCFFFFVITLSQVQTLIHTLQPSRLIPLTVVYGGDNVTFDCNVSEKDLKFVYWYKQSLGYLVEKVASGGHYDLTITNVTKEDEATYLCHAGTTYSQTFISGKFLAVNGETVTLQCFIFSKNKERVECPTEPRMYWYRAESDRFHPGIIYTQGNISDKDLERSCSYSLSVRDSSDAGIYYSAVGTCGSILFGRGTKRSCVYHLSKTLKDSLDFGTYYCAVALCGEILLGGGSTLEKKWFSFPEITLSASTTIYIFLLIKDADLI